MSAPPQGTVARAIQVLRCVAEAEGEVTVAEIAKTLGLPRPTIYRQLALLGEQGVVTSAGRGYTVGPDLVRLASIVHRRNGLVQLAAPMMRRIVDACGETCLLGVYLPAQRQMAFAAQAASPQPLGYTVRLDDPVSVLWGSSGRAILAHLPADDVEAIRAAEGPAPATGRAVPSAATLERQLSAVRRDGFAYTEGDKIADSRGIAAPILGPDGLPVGSLCVTIPVVRYDERAKDRYAAAVVENARDLSRMLGHT